MPTSPSIPSANWREFAAWLLRRRARVRVEGISMRPLLEPGDELLYQPRARLREELAVGDVVVASHPKRPGTVMVKRVVSVDGQGRIAIAGDNPSASTDSRQLGPVDPGNVLGLVTSVFAKRRANG